MSSIQLLNFTPEELAQKVAEIVKAELVETLPNQSPTDKPITDFIPANVAVQVLGIKKPTLWRYVKAGKLTQYNFEGKTFYSLSEIESKMTPQNK